MDNSKSSDEMNRSHRQTGAFILATVVFLMVAGSVMLYAMTNFSVVSSATTSVTHNGNMALMAAQSGLKHCVAQLDGAGTTCTLNPAIAGVSSPNDMPCKIKVSIEGGACASGICTINSAACCPNSADSPLRGAKKLSVKVQKIGGGIQMIPASRQVVTPDACPL